MLYIVGTPIGNVGDISPRAKEILESVDCIACEDTRRTGLLLSSFSIKNKLMSYHEHNKAKRGEEILSLLRDGKNVAVVSDAGMPCISDPGEDLVRACRNEGLEVSVVPGPVAAVSALCVSGFSGERFVFEGFLPAAGKKRKERMLLLPKHDCTFILYEAPHRLLRTLEDFSKMGFSQRRIAFCRELTKKFEEVLIMTVEEAISVYQEKPPKGEFVLVIEGASENLEEKSENAMSMDAMEERIKELYEKGVQTKQIAKELSLESDLSKKEIYKMAVQVLENQEEEAGL